MNISKKALDALNASNVEYVEVYLHGGGDSGEITDTFVAYREGADKLPQEEEDALVAEVETLAYAAMDESHVDWYNGEGGAGEVQVRRDDAVGWICTTEVSQYVLNCAYRAHNIIKADEGEEET